MPCIVKCFIPRDLLFILLLVQWAIRFTLSLVFLFPEEKDQKYYHVFDVYNTSESDNFGEISIFPLPLWHLRKIDQFAEGIKQFGDCQD